MIHARIQKFSSGVCVCGGGGGVQVHLACKKSSDNAIFILFFGPQIILQKSSGYFQRKLLFAKVLVGVKFFPGGSNFLQGGPIASSQ